MKKISGAISEIYKLAELAGQDKWLNNVHPLPKLLVTIFFISMTVSFERYNISGLLGMVIYLIVIFVTGEISFNDSIYRMRIVLPIVCFVGILNPFFDKEIMMYIGKLAVSAGVLSMFSLMIKGIFTVLAAYLLIATTTIDEICYALRMLHIPKVIVTVEMLIYRYITLLMQEVSRLSQAYALRAPKQKGIQMKAWGSFAGQLLLRSMERAEMVYDSMLLRGFHGEINSACVKQMRATDYVYLSALIAVITGLRVIPVFELVGNMFM